MLRVDCDFVIQIGGFHSLFVQVSGAESRTVKFVFLRQEKLRRAGLKAFHNVIRNGVHELDYIPLAQQLAAETVETLDFPPSLMSFIRLFANARGKLASGNRRD